MILAPAARADEADMHPIAALASTVVAIGQSFNSINKWKTITQASTRPTDITTTRSDFLQPKSQER